MSLFHVATSRVSFSSCCSSRERQSHRAPPLLTPFSTLCPAPGQRRMCDSHDSSFRKPDPGTTWDQPDRSRSKPRERLGVCPDNPCPGPCAPVLSRRERSPKVTEGGGSRLRRRALARRRADPKPVPLRPGKMPDVWGSGARIEALSLTASEAWSRIGLKPVQFRCGFG